MGECSQAQLVEVLGRLAPLELAGDWDNVGLLVEPTVERPVRKVLLTIDLTEEVLAEARGLEVEFVVAYHPPIFAPLKRLTQASEKERIIVRALEEGIGIYSPHTALDAAEGGVNDWLAAAFDTASCEPIEPAPSALAGAESPPRVGQGRRLRLRRGISLSEAVVAIKRHLDLPQLQLAAAEGHRQGREIETVALCAGAGGSVVAGEAVDLWWTGEMRHHDVLAANARGISVVLCNHTNTERGYLAPLAARLGQELPCEFLVSDADRDPLQIH